MFRVYLTNFGYFHQEEAKTIKRAKEICQKIGFECSVLRYDELIATYSPLNGWCMQKAPTGICTSLTSTAQHSHHRVFYSYATQEWNMWDAIKQLDPFQQIPKP